MPPGSGSHTDKGAAISDVKVLGSWNFTLQDDTPLYWLKCGNLEHYLLRCRVRLPCPCSAGMVFHSEAEGSGMEGVSFWMERSIGKRRYFLGGSDLESEPIVTREYVTTETDDGGFWTEEWEALVQGHTACVFLHGRKIRLKCRCIRNSGAIAFFNATRMSEADQVLWSGGSEVHFSHVNLTTLTRGPLTVSGMLAAREKILSYSLSPQEKVLQEQRDQQKRAASSWAGTAVGRMRTPELSDGRIRPKTTPALPKMPRRRQKQPTGVMSAEELSAKAKSGACRPLRLSTTGSGQLFQDPREQIKFIPALREMERNQRREMKGSIPPDQTTPALPISPRAAKIDQENNGVPFWPLPEALGTQEPMPDNGDSKLPDIYREPIEKLRLEWQQERARTSDVDRQMSITFQAIFRLEQRVATLGGSHPAKLRAKMDGKLTELNAQLAELHTYRERCTASLRRVEEDIQRIRDRYKYDAFLDQKVEGHMLQRKVALGPSGAAAEEKEMDELKNSTQGLAKKQTEMALKLGGGRGGGPKEESLEGLPRGARF